MIKAFYVFIKLSEREKTPKEDFVLLEIKYFKAHHLCLCNNHTNKMSRIHFVVLIPSYIYLPHSSEIINEHLSILNIIK